MKVIFGKYPERLVCGIHTRFMDKRYGYTDWPDQQTKFETFLEKLEDVVQSAYNVVNVLWFDRQTQKIKVRIDRHDTWGMDHTLAHIIVPMLEQLRDTKNGAPIVDNEDVPERLRMPDEWLATKYNVNGETDENFFKRWDWVLEEMIWAFQQHQKDDWTEQFYTWEETVPGDPEASELDTMLGIRIKHVDQEGLDAANKRLANGLRLFAKYYGSLWD